jgi:hypothetical protein
MSGSERRHGLSVWSLRPSCTKQIRDDGDGDATYSGRLNSLIAVMLSVPQSKNSLLEGLGNQALRAAESLVVSPAVPLTSGKTAEFPVFSRRENREFNGGDGFA